jgi:hypothetical protein
LRLEQHTTHESRAQALQIERLEKKVNDACGCGLEVTAK